MRHSLFDAVSHVHLLNSLLQKTNGENTTVWEFGSPTLSERYEIPDVLEANRFEECLQFQFEIMKVERVENLCFQWKIQEDKF